MSIRPTKSSTFSLVERGLAFNFTKLAIAQEQVATGKRIIRPSDDPVGTARALSMRRQLGILERFTKSVESGRPILETSTAALEEASGILSEARALVVQSMSGSMNPTDREAIGLQLELILEKLVDVANSKTADRYVFAGTATDEQPYRMTQGANGLEVTYHGNEEIQKISIGFAADLALNIPGSVIFGSDEMSGVDLSGLTGLTLGTSANQGSGYVDLQLRHDATTGVPGSGLALVSGGALDTILADHTLTVDAAAGTIQLDSGKTYNIPQPADADYADFAIKDENGAELHLDFSGYTGVNSVTTLTGEGSISLDGTTYTALTYAETDLELIDDSTGTVLHVNTTDVRRAGKELAGFTGATDIFSVLTGIAADLKNPDSLPTSDVVDRIEVRFGELETNFNKILQGLGTLGARTERILSSGERLEVLHVNVTGLLSQVEDADLSDVVLDMTKAEQTLQLAQMTGSRLIQNTLLNYLK
jgi:flagellar hook-associated protein 3 FlgL